MQRPRKGIEEEHQYEGNDKKADAGEIVLDTIEQIRPAIIGDQHQSKTRTKLASTLIGMIAASNSKLLIFSCQRKA